METQTIYEVVKKLTGPIDPQGETNTDEKRFENLKKTTELIEKLIDDLNFVARNHERYEFSIKRAGQHAKKFIENLNQ
jgi:hypothetical protein